MTRENESFDSQPAASNTTDDDDELRVFLEESKANDRRVLEEKYEPDVRLLAADEEKLLCYLESDNLSMKRVALLCLMEFHKVYPERMVRVAVDYLVDGNDTEIRSLCISYLERGPREQVTTILRDCAARLRDKLGTGDSRTGDEVVLRCLAFSLHLITEGPAPFAYMAGLAEQILARLKRTSEGND